jgi:hypothetical protein
VINQVEDSAQVVGGKINPTSAAAFDGFLGHNIIKVPLPFDNAIWMLYNGLASAVDFIIILDSLF